MHGKNVNLAQEINTWKLDKVIIDPLKPETELNNI